MYRALIRCIICGDWENTSSEGTTQCDPLAMAMYALAVKSLIEKLKLDVSNMKQVWYADNATGTGICDDLSMFWDSLQIHGVRYGYHPNAIKTHLIVKNEHVERARELFAGTGINITTEGKQHLGAAIGSRSYIRGICSRQGEEVVGRDQTIGQNRSNTTTWNILCLHSWTLQSLDFSATNNS